jgi:hypothetical protein
MAKLVKAGSDIVFEIHYTPTGTAAEDRTKVGMVFATARPAKRVLTLQMDNEKFVIPAGEREFRVSVWGTLPNDALLLGFFPHMHLRGTSFEYTRLLDNGLPETLLKVKPYDFYWQLYYRLAEPMALKKGTRLNGSRRMTTHGRIPQSGSAADVRYGPQSWEEMMVGFFDVAVDASWISLHVLYSLSVCQTGGVMSSATFLDRDCSSGRSGHRAGCHLDAGSGIRAEYGPGRARRCGCTARSMTESLARIEGQMRELESQRQHSLGGVETHLAMLSKETLALSQALRGPNARGRWGELTLRRVAELAGMSPYCDFLEQQSEDRKRPDMIVKLPGGRTLAVDAKAPLAAYLDSEEAADPGSRAAALDRHASQLWRHVIDLSARGEYWAQFDPAPEMVVLFLPGEHFYERRAGAQSRAAGERPGEESSAGDSVTGQHSEGVSYGWRQERLAKNADELRRIAGESSA